MKIKTILKYIKDYADINRLNSGQRKKTNLKTRISNSGKCKIYGKKLMKEYTENKTLMGMETNGKYIYTKNPNESEDNIE